MDSSGSQIVKLEPHCNEATFPKNYGRTFPIVPPAQKKRQGFATQILYYDDDKVPDAHNGGGENLPALDDNLSYFAHFNISELRTPSMTTDTAAS